jgi:hypothetical protein
MDEARGHEQVKHLGSDDSTPSLSCAILGALETLYPDWVESWEMEDV